MKKGLTVASVQGMRIFQEDRYCISPFCFKGDSGLLLAVMDGHCGSADVAEYCRKNIPKLLKSEFTQYNSLERCLNNLVAKLAEGTKDKHCGSTLSIACVTEKPCRATIAILGDSPVIILGKNGLVLSPEHNVGTNLKERSETEKRGGAYSNDGYVRNSAGNGLQLSRSLGDRHFTGIISREPEIYSVDLCADSIIIVATDGFLNPTHSNGNQQRINKVVKFVKEGKGARALINWMSKWSPFDDNATVIVWRYSTNSFS